MQRSPCLKTGTSAHAPGMCWPANAEGSLSKDRSHSLWTPPGTPGSSVAKYGNPIFCPYVWAEGSSQRYISDPNSTSRSSPSHPPAAHPPSAPVHPLLPITCPHLSPALLLLSPDPALDQRASTNSPFNQPTEAKLVCHPNSFPNKILPLPYGTFVTPLVT